ncbi:MAG: hypothetical protein RTU30_11155 [Candidatus Thorarchaeota archaeon]
MTNRPDPDSSIEDILKFVTESCYEDEFELAEVLLREKLQIHPDNLDIRTQLGVIVAKRDNDVESEKLLRDVLDTDPFFEPAISALGNLLDNTLRSEEAEQLYRNKLSEKGDCHSVIDDLCRLLWSEDHRDTAHNAAREHASKFPTNPNAYDALRYVLSKMEDYLEEKCEDADYADGCLIQFADTFASHIEVLLELESNVPKDIVIQGDFQPCIDQDLVRITGELEHLNNRLAKQNTKISTDLRKRIETVLDVGSQRR